MMTSGITGSVRRKMMVIIIITTFAALLIFTLALLSYEAREYEDFLVNDLTTQADILATNTAAALAFDDPEAADANLALLANRTGIVAGAIYTRDGELFATYRRGAAEVTFPVSIGPTGPHLAGDEMSLFHPIVRNGELLGTVFLQANYQLADRIRDYLLILGAIMAASLLAATLLSLRLQDSVTGPILAVTNVAQRIIRDRDFQLRAPRTTDDEIGTLVDAFNAMLAEVSKRQQDLEESNRKLQQESDVRLNAEKALLLADRRKDEFLATLAHELRNPLAPMVNALTLLDAPDAPLDSAKNARAIINRQLSHMIRLLEDLLDVSRISRGKLTIRKELVELQEVLKSAVDTVQPLLDAKDQSLSISSPDTPVYLQADPVRLSQVLSNLLNNAIKYTSSEGCIKLSVEVHEGSACIAVSDSGKGIPSATLPHIFDMFVQDENSDLRSQPGLGVGLALAKRLIELHDGTIEAISEGHGRGSTFSVRIPVQATASSEEQAEVRRPSSDCSRYRILLVDDNVDFATSLCILLQNLGHDVRVAHDAPEALAEAASFKPDFAFLDIGLPTMDGYELARRLVKQLSANVYLVAISGWGQKEDRRLATEAGFVRYLVKPVDLTSILEVLESLPADQQQATTGASM